VVVAKWDTCDLHETVKEGVPVHVGDVVAMGGVVVREEGDAGHLLHFVEVLLESNRPRTWHCCADPGNCNNEEKW